MSTGRRGRGFICLQCRSNWLTTSQKSSFHTSGRFQEAQNAQEVAKSQELQQPHKISRSSVAPKPVIDIKEIREQHVYHKRNSIRRNFQIQSGYPARIQSLSEQWNTLNHDAMKSRIENNQILRILAKGATKEHDDSEAVRRLKDLTKEHLIAKAGKLKKELALISKTQSDFMTEMETLALALPNHTSKETPSTEAMVRYYISKHPSNLSNSDREWSSHIDIGSKLELLDFEGAATTSGWGWYFLTNEGADLEQALVQYALSVARKKGWKTVSPPSMVYSHIASACGFQPRDQNGETQIYNIQQSQEDAERKPGMSLAGTAEIPLAGMKAQRTFEENDLPLRCVGVSRSYRAEAGARGVDTKGLYRVHEFTKVEMFAWTKPDEAASSEVFDEMLAIQTEILSSLDLHCRVLEMPATDLGASATRKNDIEAYFPSRRKIEDGWGEVTSVSTCTDYQTRRLATRLNLKSEGNKLVYPYTVNGTAMAVPRVLAAILENGWDNDLCEVKIPKVLWSWMDGKKVIKK